MDQKLLRLSELKRGQSGLIVAIKTPADATAENNKLARRLAEMGLVVGQVVSVRHFGPIARDPVAVFVRGSIVAVSKDLADLILTRPREGD